MKKAITIKNTFHVNCIQLKKYWYAISKIFLYKIKIKQFIRNNVTFCNLTKSQFILFYRIFIKYKNL